jgi:hypothetical protein
MIHLSGGNLEMTEYTKFIGLLDRYYTREFEKVKHHKNKIRVINESTVLKSFLNGDAVVRVVIEETDKEITIYPDSPEEDIRKYLGKKFLRQ